MALIPLLFFRMGQSPRRFFSNVFVLCFIQRASRVAYGAAAAVTATACICELPASLSEPALPQDTPDSITISLSADYPIKHTDILIYRDIPTKPLERHLRTDSMKVRLPPVGGDRIVVAIANCPREFRIGTLASFDSAEKLTMYYRDDNPEFPLMSCVETLEGENLHMSPVPLLCPITIVSMDNRTGETLQRPEVRLKAVNASAEMLRSDGFRPVETVDSPEEIARPSMMRSVLPHDLGLYTQYPGLKLYCYPNDGEETVGTPHTILVFSAIVCGTRREWYFTLPAVARGHAVPMNIVIE